MDSKQLYLTKLLRLLPLRLIDDCMYDVRNWRGVTLMA